MMILKQEMILILEIVFLIQRILSIRVKLEVIIDIKKIYRNKKDIKSWLAICILEIYHKFQYVA